MEQEVADHKMKAKSIGRVVSKELKDKLIAYHANDKAKNPTYGRH